MAVWTFGKLLIVLSAKVNLIYFCYPAARKCSFSYLIKQNCLLKNFSNSSDLEDSGIKIYLLFLPAFPFRTNLKLSISVTCKIAKKFRMNLDSLNASSLDCIPVVVLINCELELSYILAELFNISFEGILFSRLSEDVISGPFI